MTAVLQKPTQGRDSLADYPITLSEYEGGVRKYWIIDPHAQNALFYQRDAHGRLQNVPASQGIYSSQVLPVIQLQIDWLWKRRPIREILRDWKLI